MVFGYKITPSEMQAQVKWLVLLDIFMQYQMVLSYTYMAQRSGIVRGE